MFDVILLPIEPETLTSWEKALPAAVNLARMHDARLVLMSVVPGFNSNIVASYFPKDFEQKIEVSVSEQLTKLADAHIPDGLLQDIIVAHGRAWQEICRVAKEKGADLIVMASHKPEFRDVLLAPTADQVLHHTPISVMIVR